jgi:hypothetical protein
MSRTVRRSKPGARVPPPPPKRPKVDRSKEPQPEPEYSYVDRPIVGKVRMVRTSSAGWKYDPTFVPKLPKGAIAGDITRQVYCCASPHYAYVDSTRTCVQCRQHFVFSATEQKYWYETMQFNLHSTAIRCVVCRRKRRSDTAISRRYQEVLPLHESSDPIELIEFVSALHEMIERTGTGKVGDLVAAARRARKLEPTWGDPLYWEALGHHLAGRSSKSTELLQRFVDECSTGRATRRLIEDARRRLSVAAPN